MIWPTGSKYQYDSTPLAFRNQSHENDFDKFDSLQRIIILCDKFFQKKTIPMARREFEDHDWAFRLLISKFSRWQSPFNRPLIGAGKYQLLCVKVFVFCFSARKRCSSGRILARKGLKLQKVWVQKPKNGSKGTLLK